jgi:hypothetical protein
MGGFFTFCGIAGVGQADVERELRACAKEQGGRFAPDREGLSFPDGLVITPGASRRLSIVLPVSLERSEPLAKRLSQKFEAPVFLFHIHDGDFWMYWLFASGQQVDQFNPIPDYWGTTSSDQELNEWAGNAQAIAQNWPDLKPQQVERYLVSWDLESDEPGKSYPDDRYPYGDCQQLSDFMRRLGLKFPLDDEGNPVGDTYWFAVP